MIHLLKKSFLVASCMYIAFSQTTALATSYLKPDDKSYKKYHTAAVEFVNKNSTGFTTGFKHGVLISPETIITTFGTGNIQGKPENQSVQVGSETRKITYQCSYPHCTPGKDDIGVIHTQPFSTETKTAKIYGMLYGETFPNLLGRELFMLSRGIFELL